MATVIMAGNRGRVPDAAPVQVGAVRLVAGAPAIETHISRLEAMALRQAADSSPRRRILEIGSAWGFSTVLMAQVADLVVAVDPHDVWNTLGLFLANLERYQVLERVMVVKGRSEDELPRMLGWGAERFFDLAFVDGDHSEAMAEHDIRWARRLVKPGGIIAVHDFTQRWPGVAIAARRQLGHLDSWRIESLLLAVNDSTRGIAP